MNISYLSYLYTDDLTTIENFKNYIEVKNIVKIVLISEIIFFILLNLIIHFFYRNYLKKDIYKKLEIIEKYLKDGKELKSFSFEKDFLIGNLWEIIKKWQDENLKNISKLNSEKRVLKQIINSVDTALYLFDENLDVIVRNERLPCLFEKEKEHYIEAIKDIEIIDVLKRSIEEKKGRNADIYIPRVKRYFRVKVRYIKEDNRYLLTVKDTTQTRGMIEVQKTFISNVSHELKTPLTNIKGYMIALEDAPEPLRQQFIKTVNGNIDKLENIIVDFLNITKIEKSNLINIEKVSLEKLKQELEISLRERIKNSQANISYNVTLMDKSKNLKLDFEKVLIILKNLVENAIIYRGTRIPEIEISIIETRGMYKFGVKDNGIGINPDDLSKVFERFYRVDKARTSNKAGTGLGLAIVKELVEKLGGKIEVLSKEGKGSIFIFTILK